MSTSPELSVLNRLRARNLEPEVLQDILTLIRACKAPAKPASLAIVGMGCRLPSDIRGPAQMWDALWAGYSGMNEFPARRWNIDDYYSSDPQAPGHTYVRSGGFLADVDEMDCLFFGIAPTEAAHIDPQHRLLLEVTWEAIENGGLSLAALQRARTGVFIGIGSDDYSHLTFDNQRLQDIGVYCGTGTSRGVGAGRVSFLLGLTGPSFAVDTACSSGLTAVHQAVLSLQTGECDYAFAGGVNLVLSPHNLVSRCRLGTLSPTALSRSFDDAADGFALGEACAVIALRRLDDALRDGDIIHAVLLASGANHNGRGGNGLTAPNGLAQEQLLRNGLQRAGLAAGDIDYLEAHGPGTKLGDTIEFDAIARVYAAEHSAEHPLHIGSVKANFGHSEAASGIVALIKSALIVKHRQAPPQVNFRTPSSEIAWDDRMAVATRGAPLPGSRPVRAAVSSFGIGGSNVHMIVESAPERPARGASVASEGCCLLLSASDESSLPRQAQRMAEFLEHTELALEDICFTLAVRGEHRKHRLAIVAKEKKKTAHLLRELVAGRRRLDVYPGVAAASARQKTAFVYTGHGAQYPGMAKPLYARYRAFREVIDRCDGLFRQIDGRGLCDFLLNDHADEPDEATLAHASLFAYEVALSTLLAQFGLEPGAVIGHSVGEYAAAHVAGVFDLADAFGLLIQRARLIDSVTTAGGMLAVMAPPEVLAQAIHGLGGELEIAAVNGESACVASGPESALLKLQSWSESEGFGYERLAVSHASHSSHMAPLIEPMRQAARTVTARTPSRPFVSNLSGDFMSVAPDEDYWARHLRQTVLFHQGIQAVLKQGYQCLIEIGPKAVLSPLIRASFPDTKAVSPGQPKFEALGLQRSLAELFSMGHNIQWAGVYAGQNVRRVELPPYEFKKSRFWKAGALQTPPAEHPPPTTPRNGLFTRVIEHCAAVFAIPVTDLSPDTLLPAPSDRPTALIALKNRLNADLGLALSSHELWHHARSPAELHEFLRQHCKESMRND